jgi:hypothetical protein
MFLILSGTVIFGFLGTLWSDKKWHFRLNDGGFGIPIITYLTGGILPMIGNWYPDVYHKDLAFKRSLAVVSICKWGFVIAVGLLGFLPTDLPLILAIMNYISYPLLVFYCLPFYPFESFAGGRVFQWNKIGFAIMAILSVGIVFW